MFKPVLAFLKKKRAGEKKIEESIAKKESELLGLEKKKHNDLQAFRQAMKAQYRFKKVEPPAFPSKIACKIDKKKADNLIKEAEGILVTRVPHVD